MFVRFKISTLVGLQSHIEDGRCSVYVCIFARTREKSLNLKMEHHHMNQRRIKNRWVADSFYKDFVEPGLCNNY